MALILGINCGLVAVAPTADPDGSTGQISSYGRILKVITPSDVVKITEIGWYANVATEEANWEGGLYAADGAIVPGEAGTRLYVSATNAKGTNAGWKKATVDWSISGNTVYWLAVQLDITTTTTFTDRETTGGPGTDVETMNTLPNPFGGGALANAEGICAIYALYETSGSGGFLNRNYWWFQ